MHLVKPDLFSFIMTSAEGLCFLQKLQMAAPIALEPSLSTCSIVAATLQPPSDASGMKIVCRKLSDVSSCRRLSINLRYVNVNS